MQHSGQKRGKIGLFHTSAQEPRGAGDFSKCSPESGEQVQDIVGATIGQLSFRQRPHPLIGVEFRRVRGKIFEAKTRDAPPEIPQGVSLVGPGIVQQGDHRTPQVSQQMAEERADFDVADIRPVKLKVQSQTVPLLETDRHAGNR